MNLRTEKEKWRLTHSLGRHNLISNAIIGLSIQFHEQSKCLGHQNNVEINLMTISNTNDYHKQLIKQTVTARLISREMFQ